MRFNPARLRELREVLGYTVEAFAVRLGVTKQALSQWETGASEPRIGHLIKVAKMTGARVESFFLEDDSDRPSVEGGDSPPPVRPGRVRREANRA